MSADLDEIWRVGFEAGERPMGSRCPFRDGTAEAEAWEDGWTQGFLKREGMGYRDAPHFGHGALAPGWSAGRPGAAVPMAGHGHHGRM